jgi:uncharacterized protein (TIGR00369 family)
MTTTPQIPNLLYEMTEGLGVGELADVGGDFGRSLPPDCLLTGLGIELVRVGRGSSAARMRITRGHLNQRGVAQAGAVVALADAAAGWASYSALEDGRFTTLALDVKLIRPVREGDVLVAVATTLHLGRRTHLVDVTVANESRPDKAAARFSCQQLVLGATAT